MRPNVPVDAVRAVDHDDGGGDDHDGRVDDHVVPVVVRRAPPQLGWLQNGKKQIFRSSCCWLLQFTLSFAIHLREAKYKIQYRMTN